MAKDSIIQYKNISVFFNHDNRVLSKYEYNKLVKLTQKALPEIAKFLESRSFKFGIKIRKISSIEIGLDFCGTTRMKQLNSEYRNKNKVTDVLSFPTYENFRGFNPLDLAIPILALGDVVICAKQALKQAQEHDIDFYSEAIHLFIHGLLHLLGFDHEISTDEEKLMERKEKEILKNL